ncbi:MAG: hypothetical protein K2G55_13110, partial [Lachnospiraceae bacterium]|nr:hypothetical protein [Lachnospiraceae bacterium]
VKANYDLPDRRLDEKPNSWDTASSYRQRSGWQEFMAVRTARECLEMTQNDADYVLIVTDRKAGNGKKVQQWVYQDCEIALEVQWQDDGIRHIQIGESELVLAKTGGFYQVLVDNVNHFQAGSRWNIIVYDKVTEDVVANLVFDE